MDLNDAQAWHAKMHGVGLNGTEIAGLTNTANALQRDTVLPATAFIALSDHILITGGGTYRDAIAAMKEYHAFITSHSKQVRIGWRGWLTMKLMMENAGEKL